MFQTLFPNVVDMKAEFIDAIWQTIYMTLASAFFAGILGLATGILLVITEEGGIAENKPLYGVIDKLVNLLRSVPFIILLAVISPLTILIVGTSVGTTAAIVPLVFGIFPFYARQIQTALLTVDRGVIEAAESVGSSPLEIIFRVYLREGLAEIIRTSTITVISLIGLTTMAGAIGSGGLGDIAISIGYARYENDITLAATLVILVMVFFVQIIGDILVKLVENHNEFKFETKTFLGLAAGAAVVLLLVFGLSSGKSTGSDDSKTIVVGSTNTDYQVWKHIAKSNAAKKLNLHLKVKNITNGVQLNDATSQGSLDVNAFQSWSYMDTYNRQHKGTKLVALGTTYYEPMGLYSKKYSKPTQIPDGATIAIADNPSQAARGLLLLQSAGMIKLKSNFDYATGTVSDITENPHKYQFKQIDDTTGPRILNSVDAVIISNSVAFDGGLNVLKDSIYHETINKNTRYNINIIATAKKNENNKEYKKLVKLFHSKEIQEYVGKKFDHTKVEVKKPVSYLK